MKDPINIHIGSRLRSRRGALNLTQKQLGDICGISTQHIQKYETAVNKMSAARLWQLAEVLEVSVDYFYEGLGEEPQLDEDSEPHQNQHHHMI